MFSEIPVVGRFIGKVSGEQAAAYRVVFSLSTKLSQSKIRARKYGVENTLTKDEFFALLNKSRGVCFYCGQFVGVENLGIDHIEPMYKGGANSIENVNPSCFSCNVRKNGEDLSLRARRTANRNES